MKRVMVRYQVKPELVADNERYLREVFAQLAREAPPGVRYATFKLPDGISFVHLASIETDDETNPLLALSAFQAFVQGIRDRCDVPPATFELEEVGAYRVFAG